MKKYNLTFILLALISFLPLQANNKQTHQLKVLQFNIWQEGTIINDGFNLIIEQIISLDPDLVTFSEVRNYKNTDFIQRMTQALSNRGKTYYGLKSEDTGILSKYKINTQKEIHPLKDDHGSIIKANITINGAHIALYSAHLDWLNCALYLPRGYDGSTWKKLAQPIIDCDSIYANNRSSFRDNQIKDFIKDTSNETKLGHLVILGGDFNEPSHLDWQANTKDIRDHRGTIINWDCSMLLAKAGFKDSFREIFPDAIKNPGFTFPAYNPLVDIHKLIWAPDADDRNRIDFIYYYPNKRLKLKGSQIIGPKENILYGKPSAEDSGDYCVTPIKGWPTDHKALLTTFYY